MNTVKHVCTFLVFAALVTYVVLAVTILPATRNALMAATSGQAFALAFILFCLLLNEHAPTLARISAKLGRLTRRQIKLFFAQVIIWSVGIGALVYSIITQL